MSLNQLVTFIGLRYIRSRQEEGFFSLVSIFSFAAMTLGVAALIIVLSVMNGFDKEIKLRILNVIPHLSLHYEPAPADKNAELAAILGLPGVEEASYYVDGEGMLSAQGQLQGVSIQGVDPASNGLYNSVADSMIMGGFDQLQPGEFGVVLGAMLARSLKVVTGDQVLLTLPEVILTPAGVFPRVKTLTVVGIFQVGAQVDTGLAFIHVDDASKLYRTRDRNAGIRVRLVNPFELNPTLGALQDKPGLQPEVTSWQSSMKTLFAAIKMEKTVVGLLMAVIIAVAGFNIIASLVLMVASKRKDIAVLRAMGATAGLISGIFRVQGTVAGLVGGGSGGGKWLSYRCQPCHNRGFCRVCHGYSAV
jgi:ABC-type transport system, involved in lipoprotein release, permease component